MRRVEAVLADDTFNTELGTLGPILLGFDDPDEPSQLTLGIVRRHTRGGTLSSRNMPFWRSVVSDPLAD
jgi:hypothetical protein